MRESEVCRIFVGNVLAEVGSVILFINPYSNILLSVQVWRWTTSMSVCTGPMPNSPRSAV